VNDDLQTLLDETKRICEAATPGPWELSKHNPTEILQIYSAEHEGINSGEWVCEPVDEETGAFIASARTALPRLVAALELALEYDNERICELFKLTDPMFDTAKEMKARRDAELARVLEGKIK